METKANSSESGHSPRPRGRTRRFEWRAFVSVTTMLSFLGMSVTGVVLFVTPPGRIAHWTGWTLSGLTKDQWVALHIWFSLVFLVTAAFHLYLNCGNRSFPTSGIGLGGPLHCDGSGYYPWPSARWCWSGPWGRWHRLRTCWP